MKTPNLVLESYLDLCQVHSERFRGPGVISGRNSPFWCFFFE